MADIKVPSVGESIVEGTIARWLKQDGEAVTADEPLFELETEKATTEVAAPASGTLHITVAEGKTVPIGTVIGSIREGPAGDGKKPASKPAAAPAEAHRKPHAPREEPHEHRRPHAPREEVPHAEREEAPHAEREAAPPLSPSVRRLVSEKNVDVSQLAGSGPGGRITREDVLALAEKEPAPAAESGQPRGLTPPAQGTASPAQKAARESRQRMSAIRQRIAERLVAAKQTAAILTTFNEADMSAVSDLRQRYKETFQKKFGVGLSFMSFFVKAAVEALRAFPIVNSRIDGEDIVTHHFYDISVAVSTEKGLMVPVLRNADQLSFAEIEQQIAQLADKARTGKISVNDLQGGTFTITNGGVFGSLLSTPILNPPQSGILGMHAIQKRPIAVDDQVVIHPMMYLALSYDHRLVDGREAVLFLVRIKECIEHPERMLLEV